MANLVPIYRERCQHSGCYEYATHEVVGSGHRHDGYYCEAHGIVKTASLSAYESAVRDITASREGTDA